MERPRTMTQCDPSAIFTRTLGTAATFIAPTWRGLYTQRAEAFRNNKSGTKYCMLAISQKKAGPGASSITRDGPRSRRSAPSSRSAERAAPVWTARRNQIAPRHRSPCRSRFAARDLVRRRSTASAPGPGTLRSVTLAGCASGGSRLRATVEVWVRRLRHKNGAG